MKMKVERIHQDAQLPKRAHEEDAGLDVVSVEGVVIEAHERVLISTGIRMNIPKGHVGLIRDRSSVAWKKGILVGAGVIDPGYEGEWKILVVNTTEAPVSVEKNERIAQVLIIPLARPEIEEGKINEDSSRGKGGFGSTGI